VPTLSPEQVHTGPVACSLQILYAGQTMFEQELITKIIQIFDQKLSIQYDFSLTCITILSINTRGTNATIS
jgi:hypothetical protein